MARIQPHDRRLVAGTVGELIDILSRYDRNTNLTMLGNNYSIGLTAIVTPKECPVLERNSVGLVEADELTTRNRPRLIRD